MKINTAGLASIAALGLSTTANADDNCVCTTKVIVLIPTPESTIPESTTASTVLPEVTSVSSIETSSPCTTYVSTEYVTYVTTVSGKEITKTSESCYTATIAESGSIETASAEASTTKTAAPEVTSEVPCTTYETTEYSAFVTTESGKVITETATTVSTKTATLTASESSNTDSSEDCISVTTYGSASSNTAVPSVAASASATSASTLISKSSVPSSSSLVSSTASQTSAVSQLSSSKYSNSTVLSTVGPSQTKSSSSSSVFSAVSSISFAPSSIVSSQSSTSSSAPASSSSSCITPPTSKNLYSAKVNGDTFINHGLVGAGVVASNARDQFGDTMGGWGSGIAVDQSSWKKNSDGTYSGVLYGQPDRGWNTEHTVNFNGRIHTFDITLTPYYCNATQSKSNQLQFDYQGSTLLSGPGGNRTTGLDAVEILTVNGVDYPAAFLPNSSTKAISLDLEGLVHNPTDNTFWSSDEYGPYIYHFDTNGKLLNTIVPPDAYIPHINGVKNFTSLVDPDDGREANHGFEGLSISSDGKYLYAFLQAALVQDGGTHATREEYTRLLKYDISDSSNPSVSGEYVVALPQYEDPDQAKNPRTAASSEMHFLNDDLILILPHDSKRGYGKDNATSIFRQAELVSLSGLTDISGDTYDATGAAFAPDGKSTPSGASIGVSVPFVDYNIEHELERVGLHNGDPNDDTDLYGKWESFALVPTFNGDDDYFLITVSDNDFITQDGYMAGQSYADSSGLNIPTRALVFWVTIPNVSSGAQLVQ